MFKLDRDFSFSSSSPPLLLRTLRIYVCVFAFRSVFYRICCIRRTVTVGFFPNTQWLRTGSFLGNAMEGLRTSIDIHLWPHPYTLLQKMLHSVYKQRIALNTNEAHLYRCMYICIYNIINYQNIVSISISTYTYICIIVIAAATKLISCCT